MLKITLLPTIRDNGGIHKALEAADMSNALVVTLLAGDKLAMGHRRGHVTILNVHYSSRWRGPAIFLASILWIFWFHTYKYNKGKCQITYTHFSTFLCLSFFAEQRCFIQGLEFIGIPSALKHRLLKLFILGNYRHRSWKLFVASNTLKATLSEAGIGSVLAPVWASRFFHTSPIKPFGSRKYDICLIVRNITNKRPDLYRQIVEILPKERSIIIITPDAAISNDPAFNIAEQLYNGDSFDIKSVFCETKFLVHLSDYEGFGLPPLEAMGCGAIPLCRDSIGIRNYLYGSLEKLILPFQEILEILSDENIMANMSYLQNEVVERFLSVDDKQFVNVLNGIE